MQMRIARAMLRSALVLALPVVLSALLLAGGESTRMLRSPTVSATQIAFAYANNIWVVERAGGRARRLTSFQGQTTNPRFSPDGKWVYHAKILGGRQRIVPTTRKHGASLPRRYGGQTVFRRRRGS